MNLAVYTAAVEKICANAKITNLQGSCSMENRKRCVIEILNNPEKLKIWERKQDSLFKDCRPLTYISINGLIL